MDYPVNPTAGREIGQRPDSPRPDSAGSVTPITSLEQPLARPLSHRRCIRRPVCSGATTLQVRPERITPTGRTERFHKIQTLLKGGRVFFNGTKAEELYRRRVLPTVEATAPDLIHQRLASTSPAYAAMTYEQKLAQWSVLKTGGG